MLNYSESLLLQVDVQTREAFYAGSSLGKLYFWIPVDLALNEKIDLGYAVSPDGTRINISGLAVYKVDERGKEIVIVNGTTYNPYVPILNTYDRSTGLAIQFTPPGSSPSAEEALRAGNIVVNDYSDQKSWRCADRPCVEP